MTVLARALDAIYPHLEELKSEFAMQAITEFELSKARVLYNLTSRYFEGEYGESERIRNPFSAENFL